MINTDLENASKIMIGSLEVEAIYVGSNLIWNSVPYDAEIEYLESTGTQYIDTEMYNDNSIVVDMKMSAVGKDRLNGSEYNPNNNPNNRFKWGSNGNGYPYYGYLNNHTLDGVSFTHNNPYTFHLELSNQHVKNSSGITVLSSQDRISIFSPETIKLFRCYSNGAFVNINDTGSMRIYYCNITNSVRSMLLIPVRVGQIGYMYDKVSGKLFGNRGSGNFILGPDKIPEGYTRLPYISSTGTLYIDLGCKLSDTTDLVTIWTKFNLKNNVGNNAAVIINSTRLTDPWPGWLICLNNNASDIQIYRGKIDNQGSFQAVSRNTIYETPSAGLVIGQMQSGYTHNISTTLFCLKDVSGQYIQYAVADIYYLKIQKGNTIIKDLIPCINPNNVVGMYDLVNRTFYSSPNGNVFIAGPVVSI